MSELTAQQKIVMKWLENGDNVLIMGFTGTGKSFLLNEFSKTIPPEKKNKVLVVDNIKCIGKKELDLLKRFDGQRVVAMSQYDSDSDSEPPARPCSTICLKNKRVYECFQKIAIFRRPYLRDKELNYYWDSAESDESTDEDD